MIIPRSVLQPFSYCAANSLTFGSWERGARALQVVSQLAWVPSLSQGNPGPQKKRWLLVVREWMLSLEVCETTVLILPLFLIQKLLIMTATSWSGCELNNLVKHINACMVQNQPSISNSSLPPHPRLLHMGGTWFIIYVHVVESHVHKDSLIQSPHHADNRTHRMWFLLVKLGHGQLLTIEGERQGGIGLGSDSSLGIRWHSEEFLLWHSALRIWCCLCGSTGSISHSAQWIKDLALMQL